ncbi:MAG: hypothetical protein ACRD0G_02475 [Acidimicrobiales bacterium]
MYPSGARKRRRLGHLVRRFFGSLRPGGPLPADEAWARAQLVPGEVELWSRLSGADRRHAVGVAHDVERRLGGAATRPVLAAALLHDVGKLDSGYGTFARVAVTVWAAVAGRQRLWGRAARYVAHPQIGAAWLEAAGSDALTVAWTREHHLPPGRWTVPADVAHALKAADDD